MESPSAQQDVLFEQRGSLGLITLNRPQALNALTLGMVRALNTQLVNWAQDSTIDAVVIRGNGRAFCAGGDVKSVAQSLSAQDPQGAVLARDFFFEEYTLNHRIFTYPKPYVALVGGIVMGGGVGVSVHGTFRVIDEAVTLAMPETHIGFFPDVGGGYFLPRCPGQVGTYLALTGQRVSATDALYCGFATHHVPLTQHEELLEALTQEPMGQGREARAYIQDLIADFSVPVDGPPSLLAPNRETIDRCFGHDRVEDIFTALESESGDFATSTLETLYAASPTSLKVALRQMRTGESLHFAKVMAMEYTLSQNMVRHPDFYEGIRAALIDKDRSPTWQPRYISDVRDEDVAAFFTPRAGDELLL